jgi:hypothetical protein
MRAAASTQIDNSVAVRGAGADGPRHRGGLCTGRLPTTIVDLDESALEAARAEIETRLEAGEPPVTTSTDLEAAGRKCKHLGQRRPPEIGLAGSPSICVISSPSA